MTTQWLNDYSFKVNCPSLIDPHQSLCHWHLLNSSSCTLAVVFSRWGLSVSRGSWCGDVIDQPVKTHNNSWASGLSASCYSFIQIAIQNNHGEDSATSAVLMLAHTDVVSVRRKNSHNNVADHWRKTNRTKNETKAKVQKTSYQKAILIFTFIFCVWVSCVRLACAHPFVYISYVCVRLCAVLLIACVTSGCGLYLKWSFLLTSDLGVADDGQRLWKNAEVVRFRPPAFLSFPKRSHFPQCSELSLFLKAFSVFIVVAFPAVVSCPASYNPSPLSVPGLICFWPAISFPQRFFSFCPIKLKLQL